MQNLKKEKGGKETKRMFPQQGRTWVVNVTDQHDYHYTTPIADSISEIKYLCR